MILKLWINIFLIKKYIYTISHKSIISQEKLNQYIQLDMFIRVLNPNILSVLMIPEQSVLS